MNFLAHLVLAGDDEELRLGALLGDFIRGSRTLDRFDPGVARGIRLHRHIDAFTDSLAEAARLRARFPGEFRRYAGIVLDLAFDHELARRWAEYSPVPLETFDCEVRAVLARHDALVPAELQRFMAYADRRGLFAAYRSEAEILYSLEGVGRRLSRPNPLHRVGEIWGDVGPLVAGAFGPVFAQVQSEVADWLKDTSTTTGS